MKDIKGYFWDTNILSHFRREHPILRQHIDRVPWDKIFLPSVVVGESWRGRLRQADTVPKSKPEQAIFPHKLLSDTHDFLKQFRVVPFDEEAAEELSMLQKKVKRRKKRHADMMIAAMTLSNHFVLVTRNERDFGLHIRRGFWLGLATTRIAHKKRILIRIPVQSCSYVRSL